MSEIQYKMLIYVTILELVFRTTLDRIPYTLLIIHLLQECIRIDNLSYSKDTNKY